VNILNKLDTTAPHIKDGFVNFLMKAPHLKDNPDECHCGAETKHPDCVSCSNESTVYCDDCDQHYCDDCKLSAGEHSCLDQDGSSIECDSCSKAPTYKCDSCDGEYCDNCWSDHAIEEHPPDMNDLDEDDKLCDKCDEKVVDCECKDED